MDEFYTLEEVANRLKVSVKTVRQWIKTGQLKGIKAGKLWRVRSEDLDAFLTAPEKG
jgi:excisionase family DNA binding protein